MEELVVAELPTGHNLTGYTLRDWRTGRRYITSEYVYLDGHPYVCVAVHEASANDRPGSAGGAAYWTRALRPFVMYLVGPALYVTDGSATPVATRLGGGSYTALSDSGESVTLAAGSGVVPDGDGGNVTLTPGAADGTGTDGAIMLNGVVAAADDSAAATAGVPVGGVYQSSGALMIRLA